MDGACGQKTVSPSGTGFAEFSEEMQTATYGIEKQCKKLIVRSCKINQKLGHIDSFIGFSIFYIFYIVDQY